MWHGKGKGEIHVAKQVKRKLIYLWIRSKKKSRVKVNGQMHGKCEVNGKVHDKCETKEKVKCKGKASGQEKSKMKPKLMMQAGGQQK